MSDGIKEFEVRESLQKYDHVKTVYDSYYRKVHEQKKQSIYSNLLDIYREGEEDSKVLRQLARLSAIEEINEEFNGLTGKIKKQETKLKELDNERFRERERETFEQYNGG